MFELKAGKQRGEGISNVGMGREGEDRERKSGERGGGGEHQTKRGRSKKRNDQVRERGIRIVEIGERSKGWRGRCKGEELTRGTESKKGEERKREGGADLE